MNPSGPPPFRPPTFPPPAPGPGAPPPFPNPGSLPSQPPSFPPSFAPPSAPRASGPPPMMTPPGPGFPPGTPPNFSSAPPSMPMAPGPRPAGPPPTSFPFPPPGVGAPSNPPPTPSSYQPSGNAPPPTSGNQWPLPPPMIPPGVPPGAPPLMGSVPQAKGSAPPMFPPVGGLPPPAAGLAPPSSGLPPPTSNLPPLAGGMMPPSGALAPPAGGLPGVASRPPTFTPATAWVPSAAPPLAGTGAPTLPSGTPTPPGTAGRYPVAPPEPQPQHPPPKTSRIDPAQVPSPLAALTKVQERVFHTRSLGTPPSAASSYITVDDGNCSPRIMRSTLYNVPANSELLRSSGLPLSLVVQPLADPGPNEEPVPVVDLGGTAPVRCGRCAAYMNPFNTFVDGGRQYRCSVCGLTNEVPSEYFSPLDPNGFRRDYVSRPELSKGSVEYKGLVPPYVQRPPVPLNYMFLLDVSMPSASSGLAKSFASVIRKTLDALPSGAKFGIMTFDSTLHFYNLNASLQTPRMLVVPDVVNSYLPLVREGNLLVSWNDSKHMVDALVDRIPLMFQGNPITKSAFGAALNAAHLALKPTGGKIIVLQSSLPVLGPGSLNNRYEPSVVGTEKEKNLYQPQTNFYLQLGEQCAISKISVDVFLFSQSYSDVATISGVCKFTGGQFFYLPGFNIERDEEKLSKDLSHCVARSTGYDGVMKIRCSTGLTVEAYHGHFYTSSNSPDPELPGVHSDSTFVVKLKHDDKLDEKSEAVVQCAILYTTATGERRVRVHTLGLNVGVSLPHLFKGADMDAIIQSIVRSALDQASQTSMAQVREVVLEHTVQMLYVYRKFCVTSTPLQQQLILPEGLKLLPIYVQAAIKNAVLKSGHDVYADERAFFIDQLNSCMPTAVFSTFIYPRLFALHTLPEQTIEDSQGNVALPQLARLSSEALDSQGAYLLEDGYRMFIWIGSSASSEFVQRLLGVPRLDPSTTSRLSPTPQTPLGRHVLAVISTIQRQRPVFQSLSIVQQGQPSETKFLSYLIEDKQGEAISYVDFLCSLHVAITNRMK